MLHYGDTLQISLQAYETVIVHLDPVSVAGPALLGVRHHETGRSGKRMTFKVYARPGRTSAPLIVGGPPPSRAWLDGKELELQQAENGVRVPLAFAGNDEACTVEGGQLEAAVSEPFRGGRASGSGR